MPFDPYPPVTTGGMPQASIDDIVAIAKQRMSQNTVASAITPSKSLNPASFGTKTMQTTYGTKTNPTAPKGKDSGSHFLGIGSDHGFWGTLGHRVAGALGDTLHAVNVPHALIVSTAKEIYDATGAIGGHHSDGASFSWNELFNQAFGEKQIGFGNLVEEVYPQLPYGVKVAAGIAGDVALDPLTYLSVGAEPIANAAVRTALESGARREIAAALRTTALEAGVHESPAVAELIVQAGEKGRGAFTKAAMEKSALTAAERDALGITGVGFNTSIAGKAIPGSRIIADTGAALKGELKAAMGASRFGQGNIGNEAVANFFRRGAEDGTLDAIRTVRSATTTTAEKLAAVDALSMLREVPQDVNAWTRSILQKFTDNKLAEHLGSIKIGDRPAATEAFEKGLLTPEGQLLKDTMHEVRQAAIDAGVDIPGQVENYMPRVATKEARKLAGKNKAIDTWLNRLTDTASFAKTRVDLRSIAEQNAESMALFGKKLLEDDPAYLVQHYVDSVSRAVGKAKKIQYLVDRGHSVPLAEKLTYLGTKKDPYYLQQESLKSVYGGYKKSLKTNTRDQAKLLEAQIVLNNKVDEHVVDSLKVYRNGINTELTKTNNEIAQLARSAKNSEQYAATAAAHEATAQLKVDELQKVYRTTRLGEARTKIGKQLEQAKKDLVAATRGSERATKNAKDVLEGKTPTGGQPYKDYKVKGFQEEAQRLATIAKQHEADIASLDAKMLEVKARRVPTGLDLPAEKAMAKAKETVVKYSSKKVQHLSDAQLAKDALDVANAGKAASQPMVDQALADIRMAIGKRSKAAIGLKTNAGKAEALARSQESLAMARDILANVPNHTHEQLIASIDATIATIDAKAVIKGYAIDSAKASIAAFNDPKFFYHFEKTVSDGFRAISDTHQMPEFLLNMVEGVSKLKEPGVIDYYDKALNLWKMYATGSRPAFAVRNLISSTTNMLLEAGPKSFASMKEYFAFHNMYREDPVKYMDKAVAKFGKDRAEMLNAARDVAEVTGAGHSGIEIKSGLRVGEHPKGLGSKINPLSRDAVYTKPLNWMNRNVEELVRGSHAYDVLSRGAGREQALATVEKWHFNYSDLSSFDKAMKRVNPFWTFYSKNLELQATTWPSTLKKLNYTYFNVQRNLALGKTPDTNVPDWIQQKMGFQLNDGGKGNTHYYAPDIAFVGALKDANDLIHGNISSQLGPVGSLVINNMAGKNVNTGMSFSDSKVVSQGNILSLPPIAALTNAVGLTDKGGTTGKTLVSPRTKYNMEQPFPFLSGLDQVTGGQGGWGIANWFGLSTAENNPKRRKAVKFQRDLAIANDKARVDAIRKG